MIQRRIGRCAGAFVTLGVIAVAVLLGSEPLYAAVTGKIAGLVVDKKSKEPLIGAAVMVENTTLGAKTDVDGKYTILAVPPGEHSVQAQLIGRTSVIVRNITVKPDQTTNVNFEMEESAVELKPIEVFGKTEMIQMDQASTKRDVTAEKIKTMPVVNVGDILKTTAGVTVRNDRFHIRGGRSSELIYTVDGVSMTDPLGGRGPTQALNLSGTEIENISIVKGAWSPEYGGTSGLVNVSTKEGDRTVTQGHLQYFTDNFGTAKLNKYSFNYQRLEFTLGGPEPLITRRLLPRLGLPNLADKLSYFVSFDFNRSDTYTSFNRYTTSTTRANYRNTKFLGMIIPDRQENAGNALVKLTYRLHPDIRMTGIFKRSYERSQPWNSLSWNYRYTANTHPWVEDRNDAYSLRWTHSLSPSTYYEVLLSRYVRDYWQRPGDPNDPGGTLDPDEFLFPYQSDQYLDRNSNGRWDEAEKWVDTYPDGQYNFGDIYYDRNGDGVFSLPSKEDPLGDSLIYDFNRNDRYDFNSGEQFADGNSDGVFSYGDTLIQDGNGNGIYDADRELLTYAVEGTPNDRPEPFVDGDRSLGEPFEDVNHNGIWDGPGAVTGYPLGEPFTDLSYDGKYQSPNSSWVPGVPFRDLNQNGTFDPSAVAPSGTWSSIDAYYNEGEPFYDKNGNGLRDAAEGFYDYGWDGDVVWHEREPVTKTVKVDLVSQVRREHEVKVGLTYSAFDLRFNEVQQPYVFDENALNDGGPFPGRGAIRDFYQQSPKTGAFYVVDKMEYGQMIAQVGFRYEYFAQSSDAKKKAEVLFSDTGSVEDYRDKFAPRIAFSYPISDKAKVFFNYGHFYQLPQLHQMYRRATQLYSVSGGTFGNVNLDFAKTIKYEFGVQYMVTPEYLLSVQGFYTDDFGRVSESKEVGVRLVRNFYENSDYSRARGLELELEKRYGNYVSGSVTYNFSYAYGKSSAEALDYFENFYARTGGRFRIQEFPLDWDERHKITLILDVRVPARDHPKLFGLRIPDNFGFNIFWQFGSGFPYTPEKDHPGVRRTLVGGEDPLTNSERFPSHSNVDVRFNKDFKFGRLDYTFEIWVNNLFDSRDIQSVYAVTGRPESGVNQGPGVIYLSEREPDPRNWGTGRQIRLGVGVNF